MYEIPARSHICSTSLTVALPSAGYSTVEPCSARIVARSSSAICDGPSSPIETPACEPQSRRSARRDRAHPHEVGRAGEERPERGAERDLAERLHPHLRPDHALLGDVHLEEALRRDRQDVVGIGGVPDLAVEHDQVGPVAREPGEGVAERFAGGDRPLRRRVRAPASTTASIGHERARGWGRDRDRALPAKLVDRRYGLFSGERLPVPSLAIGQERHAVALLGARDDQQPVRRLPRPVVYAASISATSWPSISIALQPKACARRGERRRRATRAWWGRADPAGSCRGWRSGCSPRGTTPSPSPPRRTPRPSRSRRTCTQTVPGRAVEPHARTPSRVRRGDPGRAIRSRRRPTAAPAPVPGGPGSGCRTGGATATRHP